MPAHVHSHRLLFDLMQIERGVQDRLLVEDGSRQISSVGSDDGGSATLDQGLSLQAATGERALGSANACIICPAASTKQRPSKA
jgi:hypothetical protein